MLFGGASSRDDAALRTQLPCDHHRGCCLPAHLEGVVEVREVAVPLGTPAVTSARVSDMELQGHLGRSEAAALTREEHAVRQWCLGESKLHRGQRAFSRGVEQVPAALGIDHGHAGDLEAACGLYCHL